VVVELNDDDYDDEVRRYGGYPVFPFLRLYLLLSIISAATGPWGWEFFVRPLFCVLHGETIFFFGFAEVPV